MGVDVLIITANEDELKAVRQVDTAARTAKWEYKTDSSGLRYYYRDFERDDGKVMGIAAAWALGQGGIATGSRASSLVTELKPTCLAMCGACSGRRTKVFIGDLIVADLVYKYDAGAINVFYDSTGKNVSKMLPEITTYCLRPDWKAVLSDFADLWLKKPPLQRPPSIESQLRWLLLKLDSVAANPLDDNDRKTQCPNWTQVLKKARDNKLIKSTTTKPILTDRGKKFVEREKYEYPDGYQDPPQKVHSGPMGSGDKVVVDENIFEALEKNQRDILALDREANAIGYAAFQTDIKHMLVVKGVQGYADQDQDDMFKEFACQASAEFLIDFLRQHAPVDETRQSINPSSSQAGNHQVGTFSRMPYQPNDYIKHVEWGVIDALKKGLPVIVEGLPGSGKTWLIREVSEQLRQSYCIWNLNLDFLEEKEKANFKLKDFTKWMAGELRGICEGCDAKIASLWDRPSLDAKSTMDDFLKWFFTQQSSKLVLVMDQTNEVLQYAFAESLFRLFRGWTEHTHEEPGKNLRLLLSIDTGPLQLKRRWELSNLQTILHHFSPIKLDGFNDRQLRELAIKYDPKIDDAGIHALLEWLGGYPGLSRQALYEASEKKLPMRDLFQDEAGKIFEGHLQILQQEIKGAGLEEPFRKVAKGNCHRQNLADEQFKLLKSSGLVFKDEKNKVHPKCELFRLIFS